MTANGSPSWKFILETYLCVYSSRIEAVTVRLSHKVLTSLGTANLVLYLDCFIIQKHTKISMSLICNHSLCQSRHNSMFNTTQSLNGIRELGGYMNTWWKTTQCKPQRVNLTGASSWSTEKLQTSHVSGSFSFLGGIILMADRYSTSLWEAGHTL